MSYDHSPENVERIRKVADHLLGTCESLDAGLQTEFGEDVDINDIDIKLLEELDDIVLLCESCGWWMETGEAQDGKDDEQICQQCATDEDDDDE